MSVAGLARLGPAGYVGLGGLPQQSDNATENPQGVASAWPSWGLQPVASAYTYDYSSENETGMGLLFNPDGTKLFLVCDGTVGAVYQYSCSTAWSLNGISYDSVSLVVNAIWPAPQSICWNYDGSQLYVIDGSTDKIIGYNCPTPYTLASATSFAAIALGITTPAGVEITPDGATIIVGNTVDSTITEYTLDPTDISSLTASGVEAVVAGCDGDLKFNNDGMLLYVLDSSQVYQYTLAEPYKIASIYGTATAVRLDSGVVQAGVAFGGVDGSTMITVAAAGNPDDLIQYDIGL